MNHITVGIQSQPMSKDRKEIYLGEGLRRAIMGRKEKLSALVNLIADRYMGLIARSSRVATTVRMDDVYRGVLAERRRRLESHDIAAFPSLVRDWMMRNPGYPDVALKVVEQCSFLELVALIDRLERKP
jgi:hypothetical protein